MKFLLDESAEFRLAAFLQQHGHYVKAIAHDYPSGLPDRQVLAIAKNEQRILITNDRDFGELIFRQRMPHAGVILFRLRDQSLATKMTWLSHILNQYSDRLDRFLVVTARGIRIRE